MLAFYRSAKLRLGFVMAVLLLSTLVLGACLPVAASPATSSYSADVAVAWLDQALDLVRSTPGFTPPVTSRALGYMGVTLYETVRPGMAGYRSLAGQLNELESLPSIDPLARYHWPSAANSALASMARAMFVTAPPEQLAAIDALEQQFTEQFQAEVDAATLQRSQAWGEKVAGAIYDWSLTDGGHEGYLTNFPEDFTLPTGTGIWVKTPPAYSVAMQPYWGNNRPFVLADGATCPAPAPPAYSEDANSDFYREALEVYETVKQRDPEQVEIALFWADDPGRTSTPPGHWVALLGQLLTEEEAGLDLAAEGYAKLGIAVADAFITCWHTKFVHYVPRPISYIQKVIDTTWNVDTLTDPVRTPPFPEYTSGHSVQSSVSAVVLTALFGEDHAYTDRTNGYLGFAPRSYGSFAGAAQEAAWSRLYGGIHYRSAIENGVAQGRCVGERVLALEFEQ